jgi:coatomer protein complex subunit gamma
MRIQSELTLCYQVAVEDEADIVSVQKQMHEYLESLLRHKSDMVNIEAARAICDMRNVTTAELFRPVAVLQLFLSSPKAILKFAAIKTLNKLAQTQPAAVTACNLDMENLITDSNRSIATYAITTLLKVSCWAPSMVRGIS